MKESLIKWKKEDISNLRKAVNEFNRRISELESFGREVVPKRLNYKDVKAEIFTRQELNRRINEMKRLNKSSMAELITLDSGDLITRYELKQIQSAKKRAERRLISELAGDFGPVPLTPPPEADKLVSGSSFSFVSFIKSSNAIFPF